MPLMHLTFVGIRPNATCRAILSGSTVQPLMYTSLAKVSSVVCGFVTEIFDVELSAQQSVRAVDPALVPFAVDMTTPLRLISYSIYGEHPSL